MKNLFSVLVVIFLASAVMISGITLSYFTHRTDESVMHFTTGTLEVDIEIPDKDNIVGEKWEPDKEKEITYKLVNSGTYHTKLIAHFDTEWDISSVQTTVMSSAYGRAYIQPLQLDSAAAEPNVQWSLLTDGWVETGVGEYSYTPVVAPGEEVGLKLNLSIDDIAGYWGASYKITLTVEAIQTGNY